MKTNQKNIIWNKGRNNTNTGFMCIETPDNVIILKHRITGEFISVDKEQQRIELVNGRPSYHTDKNWVKPVWFYDEFYGHNNIKIGDKVMNRNKSDKLNFGGFTLGQALKKINKIEHLFPEETTISLINNFYCPEEEPENRSLGLAYKTTRKFKGFTTDGFQISKPRYFANFEKDELLGKLITFLRSNGFTVSVEDADDEYNPVQDCKQAHIYGYEKRIGISEFNNYYNGYSYGQEFILWDWYDEFNKWSQCYQISKPKSENDFQDILDILKSKSKL